MFPDMGEKTVISIVLQILKTIMVIFLTVGDALCWMVLSFFGFYHYSSNYWISFCKDIYTTTHYLYHYYAKWNHYIESGLSLLNKNAALEILFITK